MPRKSRGRVAFVEEIPFGAALSVRRWKLANGLDLMILKDGSAPVVSYQTWFGVGSRHEQPGKTGLAHFFEHLMFKETKNVGPGEFDRMMESVGGETNAATWTDWTAYYENLPKREVELAARLESDRMMNLILQEPQVESEREVVINERRFRVEDDVEGATNETLYATAYKRHPYRWPTIGWMKDIERYTVDDCLAFYRTYYAPNNATVVVAGDIDEDDIVRLVTEHYAHIPSSRIPGERKVPEPEQRSERVVVLEKPTDTEKIALGWRGPEFGTRDHAVVTVLNEILTGGRSSRLYRTLVTDGELASDVHGSIAPFHDPGLYELWANARPGISAKKLLGPIEKELRRLAETRPTEEELDKAKNRLELSFLHGMETVSGKADQIGFHAVVTNDVGSVFLQLEDWRSVTGQDVAAAASRYLARHRRTMITVVRARRGKA